MRFEHHFEGQHERWVEIPQLERQSIFRYAAEQGCLWGWLHTGEIIRLDVNKAQLTSEKVKLNKVVDITPLGAGLLLAESGGRLCYVDGDIKCSSMATMSHGDSTCLIDLCKWLDYDEYDRDEAHPGRLHTPYLLRCRAGIPEPTELAFMKVYHRRTNWTGRHLQFKVRQAGTAWRLAFLDPPNFESIVVVELPSGHGASLEMEDNLLTDGKAGFDFDTTGQVIVFQKGLSFACWKFELLPGCLPERFRVTQVPDAI